MKVTSKGQITIPVAVRRMLVAKPGDNLAFELTNNGITVVNQTKETALQKFRSAGDWLPEGYEGREGVIRYVREMRGHDEYDDIIYGTE